MGPLLKTDEGLTTDWVVVNGHPRTIECPILESVVYLAKEERHVTLHSRPATGQQGDPSECRNRTDHRRVRGGLRRKVDYSVGDLYSGYD